MIQASRRRETRGAGDDRAGTPRVGPSGAPAGSRFARMPFLLGIGPRLGVGALAVGLLWAGFLWATAAVGGP